MQELEATWPRVIAVWWLVFWRGAVGATLFGAVVGFVVGFMFALLKIPFQPWHTGVLGMVIGLIWILIVFRMAFGKQYRDFRIVLAPRVP